MNITYPILDLNRLKFDNYLLSNGSLLRPYKKGFMFCSWISNDVCLRAGQMLKLSIKFEQVFPANAVASRYWVASQPNQASAEAYDLLVDRMEMPDRWDDMMMVGLCDFLVPVGFAIFVYFNFSNGSWPIIMKHVVNELKKTWFLCVALSTRWLPGMLEWSCETDEATVGKFWCM